MRFKEIVFIGVSGGRVALARQVREFGTGGFRINGDLNIYVDPGPGAAVYSAQFNQSLENIDIVIVTHNHIDHKGDLEVLAEAMNGYGFEKKGILVASEACLKGTKEDHCDRALDKYHENMFKEIIIGKPGERREIEHNGKRFAIEFTKVDHDDRTGFGFVITTEKNRIGYTSDSKYFDELPGFFNGVDTLIINAIKMKPNKYEGHLSIFPDAENMIKKVKPDLSIITHMGYEVITKEKLEEVRYHLNTKTGEQIQIPRQGYRINLENPMMFPKKFGMLKKKG
jgi:phosphoribosyl 1,2-cyclic phosphodiesterase